MNLDVLFTDPLCYMAYDHNTLATQPLGGTEATVIRVAEGLVKAGLRVGVVQHNRELPIMGNGVYYLPESSIPNLRIKHHVMLRGIKHINTFPGARLYSWQHDLPTPEIAAWVPVLLDKRVTVIGVSSWHKDEIRRMLGAREGQASPKITYVYNPVASYCNKAVPHDKRKLVWLSSPHKGLDKALFLFDRLKDITGDRDIELHVFNPGYFPSVNSREIGVIGRGAMPCAQAWAEIRDALCVFYPCQYPETFGLVAAEANALGVPVATYRLGALGEVVSTYEQTVGNNDEKALLDLVKLWYSGSRPAVCGQDKFKLQEVISQWLTLLRDNVT